MNEKDNFDGLMRIAELRTHRATNRQNFEWKVTFGLWALITAASLYLKDKSVPLWLGPGVLLIYAFFWLRPIYVAHARDNRAAAFYLEHAISVLSPDHKIVSRDKFDDVNWYEWSLGFLSEWGCNFQLLTTAALIYCFYLFTDKDALPHFLQLN